MQGKKSFILYADLIHTVTKMPDEKAGQLLKIILEYVNDNDPSTDDLLLQIAFEPIKQQLKRDLVNWREFRNKQSENGKKGGRPPKINPKEDNPKNPSLLMETQKSLNVTATVNEINNTIADYESAVKDVKGISDFIHKHKPRSTQPYVDLWNLFADKFGTAKVQKVSDGRKRKLLSRLNDEDFDFPKILSEAKDQSFAIEGKWFTLDWLIENDTNYVKILEKKYKVGSVVDTETKARNTNRPIGTHDKEYGG